MINQWLRFNWKELAIYMDMLRPEIQNLFVDQIIIPSRNQFPNRYLKGEWAFRLTGKKRSGVLIMGIQACYPYLIWTQKKGPQSCLQATRSPFDLSLFKYLKGTILVDCQTLPQERIGVLWFSKNNSENTSQYLGLVFSFIPAAPEAILVSTSQIHSEHNEWLILARSRQKQTESSEKASYYAPPTGFNAPKNPSIRLDLTQNSQILFQIIEDELETRAFLIRYQRVEKTLRQSLKQVKQRLHHSETTLAEAEKEADWQKYGDFLKNTLGNPEPFQTHWIQSQMIREGWNYETESRIIIPCDPKLTLSAQVEKFYFQAKRKQRKIQEAQERGIQLRETLAQLEKALLNPPEIGNWNTLEHLEKTYLPLTHQTTAPQEKSAHFTKIGSQKNFLKNLWIGKTCYSSDQLMIWIGRSQADNLALTFKHARGNDLWMHVRGRPGAHVIIPVISGKSVPLETLLDAAVLTLYYSGGETWGKTEVDYTFKKYVRRIKDSNEVSYTHNKTLLITPDPTRLKRLLINTEKK